nr:uncharacterized protein LOC107444886 isoform X2 [Parasteatoda tepidariorum]
MALNAEAIKKNSSQTCPPAIYDPEKEKILLNLLSWEAELKESLIFGKNDFLKKEPKTLNCHYDYTPLGELHETQEKSNNFNVYGIVEKCDFKIYKVGNNLRQILTVSLTDKTGTDFMCSIYSLKDEMCPDIHIGDIIRIHHMQVSKDRSKLKGKCPSFKFILVFSKQNEGQKPRTVAKPLTFTDEDAARVKNLFEWYDKKNPPKLISEVKGGDFVNIICQVIGVYKAKYSDTVILKIWDGTKSNEIESSHCGLRDEKLDEKLFLIAKSYCAVFHVFGHRHCTMAAELKVCFNFHSKYFKVMN